jgi:hypothetical protein
LGPPPNQVEVQRSVAPDSVGAISLKQWTSAGLARKKDHGMPSALTFPAVCIEEVASGAPRGCRRRPPRPLVARVHAGLHGADGARGIARHSDPRLSCRRRRTHADGRGYRGCGQCGSRARHQPPLHRRLAGGAGSRRPAPRCCCTTAAARKPTKLSPSTRQPPRPGWRRWQVNQSLAPGGCAWPTSSEWTWARSGAGN